MATRKKAESAATTDDKAKTTDSEASASRSKSKAKARPSHIRDSVPGRSAQRRDLSKWHMRRGILRIRAKSAIRLPSCLTNPVE